VFTRVADKKRQIIALFLVSGLFIASCKQEKGQEFIQSVNEIKPDHPAVIGEFEQIFIEYGLVEVENHPSLITQLAYSTKNNFMGIDMYGQLQKAYLHPEVASNLKRILDYIKENHPNIKLLIYDAARPHRIQQLMWDSLELPIELKVEFLTHPDKISMHNFGAAIDVTLVDTDENILDMGTNYDDPSLLSYPSLQTKHLKEGKLTEEQVNNRELLNTIMIKGGFRRIESEWWHFNACTKAYASEHYKVIP